MSFILDKLENEICTLTINRPDQYNALNRHVLNELDSKLDSIMEENDCRVIILTGKGDKAFIAGADIQEMQKMNANQAQEFSKMGQALTIKIEESKIPIIAAVNGFALGGGCEFAMACHIRYASENAVFGQPEVSLGLIAGWGGTQRLPRLIGKGKAMEILLTGKMYSASDCLKIGLIDEIFEDSQLINEACKIAEIISCNGSDAISKSIELINKSYDLNIRDGLNIESIEFGKLFDENESKEGMSAFLEKRKPNFE